MNGVFAGAEIAVVSLRRTKLQQLREEGRGGAEALAHLREHPERFLATVQVGITVVGTTAAAFGGSTFAVHLEPLVARLPGIGTSAQAVAFGAVVVLISYLSLVLGELVPKSLALRVGEAYGLVMAKPLLALSWASKPVVWLLTASSNLVLRPFSDRTNFIEARISKEEIQQMVEEAGESGALDAHASELASRALDFSTLTLKEVMIPRPRIDTLPIDATTEQIRRFLLEARRSRIPVFDGALDNVVGYVSAKDVVSIIWEGKLVVLKDLLRPVKMLLETVPAIDVLRDMRRERHRIVIAVDEHGAVAGMVTFEDLVEEIVGDFLSESQEEGPAIEALPDGSVVVRGDAPIRDVNRELGLALEETAGNTTIAGLCSHLAGGIPNRGARLAAGRGVVLIVLDATARAVRRVKVVPTPSPASGASPSGGSS